MKVLLNKCLLQVERNGIILEPCTCYLDLVTMAKTASSQREQAQTNQELVLMLAIDKNWNTKTLNINQYQKLRYQHQHPHFHPAQRHLYFTDL